MTVDGDGRLTLAYRSTNDVPKQQLYEKLKSILGELRMDKTTCSGASPT